ncbi:MAG: serine/threonine protein phosphatase, partial [Rhodobacteraceae bacterium]|nr:serine/threonine protein phosphatase [Paracoccaceae bacterium]
MKPDMLPQTRLAIDMALAEPAKRICWIDGPEGPLWLKRAENLSFYWRLRKGNSHAAFEADRRAMRLLAQARMPVPAILAEGPDYFVTADHGYNLAYLLSHARPTLAESCAILAAAGRALAGLHLAGFCHGRPSVRDLLWDGANITLIDFERFAPQRNRSRHRAMDLLILIQSVFVYGGDAHEEAGALLAAYGQT